MKEMLITSSILIPAILLLRFLFRNTISRRVQYALWLLVVLRLLVPVSLPAVEHNVLSAAEPVSKTISALTEHPVYRLPYAAYPVTDYSREELPDSQPGTVLVEGEGSFGVVDSASETVVFYRQRIQPDQVLRIVWYIGMAVMSLWFLSANLCFARKLRRTRVPLRGAESKYPVYLCDDIPSPCLFGLFRPAIYVTSAAAKDENRLRYVIAHEETHARHLDPLWSLVRSACLAVWWFDPLVWLAAYCSKADCELACDEGTLARLGESERVPYGETLLALIPVRRGGNPMLAATTMTAGKRQMKDRITRIAEHKRPLAIALVAMLTLAGIVCAATFTGAKQDEPETVDFSAGSVIQGTIIGTITDVWNEDGKTLLRVRGNTKDAVTLTLIDSSKIDLPGGKLAVGQVVTACYELYYGAEGIDDYKPLISVVIADEQLIGAYVNVKDYIDAVRAKLTSVTYYAADIREEKVANVLDTRVALLQKRCEVSDLVPDGTLELYRYRLEAKIDMPLADVALAGGMYTTEDGWCDLEGQGGHALIVLRRADGSVDVLRDAPCNDDMGGIWHYQDSENEALYDWAVQYYSLDLPLYSVELLLGGQNKVPANRMYGDGWYFYVPVRTWWYREDMDNTARWCSRYNTGSTISIREASREELAAERPQLAEGQAERFVEAPDGRVWCIWTQYDPALLIRSDMTGLEPAVLDAMAESFHVTANTASQQTAESTALPLFAYQGDDPYLAAVCEWTVSGGEQARFWEAEVTIPAPLIADIDDSDPQDIRVWGNFWSFNYTPRGTTLLCVSGGERPGLLHLRATEGGYQVFNEEMVGYGDAYAKDMRRIFGTIRMLKLDALDGKAVLAQYIADYVLQNNLPFTQYQDYGWNPVHIPGTPETPESAQHICYADPAGWSIDYDLREFSLHSFSDNETGLAGVGDLEGIHIDFERYDDTTAEAVVVVLAEQMKQTIQKPVMIGANNTPATMLRNGTTRDEVVKDIYVIALNETNALTVTVRNTYYAVSGDPVVSGGKEALERTLSTFRLADDAARAAN